MSLEERMLDPLEVKKRMLEALERVRQVVESDEMIGLVLCMTTGDGTFRTRCVGQPLQANAILVLEEIVDDAKRLFLSDFTTETSVGDDERPMDS